MNSIPDCVAYPLEQARQCLKQAGLPALITDVTPSDASSPYTQLRVIKQTCAPDGTVHLTVAAFIPQPRAEIAQISLCESPGSGVYVLEIILSSPLELSVGSLGSIDFEPGRYLYVGSAKKGLRARLQRHARREKKLHWHIDYLSATVASTRALVWPWAAGRECRLASELAGVGAVIPRFGASGCACEGHLVRLRNNADDWWEQLTSLPPPLKIVALS